MNKLPTAKRVEILKLPKEVCATACTEDVYTNTMDKILLEAGKACAKMQGELVRQ